MGIKLTLQVEIYLCCSGNFEKETGRFLHRTEPTTRGQRTQYDANIGAVEKIRGLSETYWGGKSTTLTIVASPERQPASWLWVLQENKRGGNQREARRRKKDSGLKASTTL